MFTTDKLKTTSFLPTKKEVLEDFKWACLSRKISAAVRKEVLSGKAKFGLGSAGKEIPQLAMARTFKKGDFYSGYYRDQTFMLAKGLTDSQKMFTALYADTQHDTYSGGRQMNNHFSTPLVDKAGNWTDQKNLYNVASSLSPLAGQIPHALGIALASKMYKENAALQTSKLSNGGKEVSFCTLGDATTSEGVFFEAVNAAGVMQVPIAFVILDDGYGISVPAKYQTTKENISTVLEGFRIDESGTGLDIYTLEAWNYEKLCATFERGVRKIRNTHTPAIFHIRECTQPFGHSTSGSHQRYKSKDRLMWEQEMDGILKMEEWILSTALATPEELDEIKLKVKEAVKAGKQKAWNAFHHPNQANLNRLQSIYQIILQHTDRKEVALEINRALDELLQPVLSELMRSAKKMKRSLLGESHKGIMALNAWLEESQEKLQERYQPHLYSETDKSALKVPIVAAEYADDAPLKNGFEILNTFFDQSLQRYDNLYAFGEDVGKIGDVNQAFAGLQKKYGEERVFDTGIREWTIVGQAIGMAMRGLKPIAEIQYIDYLAYAFSPLTDDLATLRYRTNGQQAAPAIIRTRGHRLEGIWHTGSPMGMLIQSMRGIHLLVPRNMTQAAGMYNTMLQSDDPAIIVECLNGYRLKEKVPANLGEFTVPLGVPEVLESGTDITLVTYGSCVRVAEEAIIALKEMGISVELIDVQTLLPFDLEHHIVASLKKTNRILFLDEDVPGGASAFMLQEVLEKQNGYRYLDAAPRTLTATAHRTPFGDDGAYFSKPSADDVIDTVYQMVTEDFG